MKNALLTKIASSLLALCSASAFAAATDLATSPLQTSTSALVKPNIMFVLDDSGSMFWDFMPDWAGSTRDDTIVRNSGFNSIYYNPAINYSPPLKYDGTSYQSKTAANTTNWTSVPFDGYGVEQDDDRTENIFTNSDSGVNQNLVGNAYYYTFIPGEYCTAANLKTCNAQTAPSTTYPVAAGLRWCTNSTQNNCQANRIDDAPSGGSTYLTPRYPHQISAAQLLVKANNAISSITVAGKQILSAGTSADGDDEVVAERVKTNINNCTTAQTGNCQIAGYSATRLGPVLTILAPASVGSITSTPAVTRTGGTGVTITAFSGSSPGSNVRTIITSTTTSYPYPGSTTKSANRVDCAGTTCTYAEEMTNYANWWAYYRTRMQMTKTSATQAFSVLTTSFRLGYMSINNNTGSDFLNINDIAAGATGQKALWYSKLVAAAPANTTPLRKALSTAGRYYANKLGTINSVSTTDPMQYACQRNYTILSTDGYWNDSNSNAVKVDGTSMGNTDATEDRPYYDGTGSSNTLADIAEYYYATDLRTSALSNANGRLGTDVASNAVPDGKQRMITSTLGLGASGYMQYQANYSALTSGDYFDVANGTATSTTTLNNGICVWMTSGNCNWPAPGSDSQTTIDDLWHAAVNGRGNYYSAKSADDLKTGLNAFLQTVTAATANAAAATVSNPNVAASDNYTFKTTFRSVSWYGELARYSVDTTTGALSANADWSESGTVVSNSASTPPTYATPLLDNMAYTSRNIYTFDPTNATNTLLSFNWASMPTAMQAYFQVASIDTLTQFCTTGTQCIPAAQQVDSTTAGTSTGAGGINLVNFLRGDRSNEGRTNADYYFVRTHVMGDVVNSQPAYVKRSAFNYTDTGYAAFKNTNLTRQGMVYVGANDGMLHAFNADTGAESWAYIPSMLLPSLYKLADSNYSTNHKFFVDATPKTGDVYFDSAWHTILVGGLGLGGRGFYALDVTTPATPKVLWEFTSDTTKTLLTNDADLGYSFGAPLITKLSDGTWVVIVTSGFNNVSPGSGHGIVWILNAKTGAVIKKMDTGAGSSSAAVTGCAAAPCPAGLVKLSAYVESASTNEKALRIYGGDLLGNVWRFDISTLTAAGGTANIQLMATLTDPSGNRQPITARPEIGSANGNVLVFVGTGSYLGVSDISTVQQQSIYALKDPGTTATTLYGAPRTSSCTSTTITNCFVKQTLTDTAGVRTATSTQSYAVNLSTMRGWYIDLPETGERANTDPDLQLGTLAFTTNIPSTTSACTVGGSSYTNFLDYKTGLAVPGADNVGSLLANGTSLASAVTLVLLPNGKVIGIINLSDGTTVTPQAPVSSTSTGTRRISWRELVTGQ